MTIVLGHKSALEVLRLVGAGFLSLGARTYSCLPADVTANEGELRARFEDRAWLGELSRPVSVLVDSVGKRRNSNVLLCRQWGSVHDGLSGSFASVAPGVLVSLPPACLLQLSRDVPEVRLAAIAAELCGGYSATRGGDGFRGPGLQWNRGRLVRYLEGCNGIHGAGALRRVLPFVPEGLASPMEAAVVLLLCLPSALGGYGLPVPLPNHRLEVAGDLRRVAGRRQIVPDLLWPERRVVVEYDSDQNHTGPERIASDARRRTVLLGMGYEVVTLTRSQVYGTAEFDRVAKLLARLLGKRVVTTRADFPERQGKSRYLLLGSSWWG